MADLSLRWLAAAWARLWGSWFSVAKVSVSLSEAGSIPRTRLTSGSSQVASVLLAQARKVDPTITLDELTVSRLIASESNGSLQEQACIGDAELNRAERKGRSVTTHLTGGTNVYGAQGGIRPAATRQHSTRRHLAIARAVMHGDSRGISRGAERFFSPRVQDRLHAKYKAGLTPGRVHSCRAQGTLRAWSFDLPECEPYRCCGDGMPPKDAAPGPRPDAWVGDIPGVDAYEQMFMKPSSYGDEHDASFAAASEIIRSRAGLPAQILELAPRVGVLLVLALFA